ncbi:MAG: CotH kinase family protein [Anaerovoracaceae bacterium]
MIDNKHINKLAVVFMLLAVIGLMAFMICYEDSNNASGTVMDYESSVFDRSEVIDIDISIDESQWENLLENAISEEYFPCDITINGTDYKNVAIRAKGNTSLSMVASSDSDRFSFKISFDEYTDGQNLYGLSSLILNNCYSDATMMKEAICYDMFSFLGADASLYNYAKISVNGQYWGVYLALEPVDEEFAIRNYGLNYGHIYKPDSMEMGGPGKMRDFKVDSDGNAETASSAATKTFNVPDAPDAQGLTQNNDGLTQRSDMGDVAGQGRQPDGGMAGGDAGASRSGSGAELNYIDDDLDSYETIWENSIFKATDTDHSRVITALKNICSDDVTAQTLERYMDVDNILRYMAVHNFVVNLDSLSGNMAHNYYLYEEDGRLNIIPWDYNLAFGGFQSGDASEVINFPVDTPFSSGISMEDRQFFAALLENEEYLAKYHEYLRMLAEEYVEGGQFEKTVESICASIDSLVESDPTAFYTYEEYTAAADMLVDTAKLRAESVLGQIEGSIPSTWEGQQSDSEALIDASGIDISVMGTQGGNRDGNQANDAGGKEETPPNDQMPGDNSTQPEMPGGGQTPPGGGFGGQPPDGIKPS